MHGATIKKNNFCIGSQNLYVTILPLFFVPLKASSPKSVCIENLLSFIRSGVGETSDMKWI